MLAKMVSLTNWPYVIIMLHTRFRVNLHSIFAWISRNALLKITINVVPKAVRRSIKNCSLKFCNIHRKATVLESSF